MCGRFTMASPAEAVAELFGLSEVPELAPRFNIAPTQDVATVVAAGAHRELRAMHWGLIPGWAKDQAIGARMINARAETLAEKPAFRAAFRSRRCLIVADGFYEWQKGDGRKQPYLIRLRDGRPFAFAGLWESWNRGGGEPLESCTIITTTPNLVVAPLHDRMPVILDPSDHGLWLDPTVRDADRVTPLLQPYSSDGMTAHPVSLFVNNPRNDDPCCIEPLAR